MHLRDAIPKINEVSEAEALFALENTHTPDPQLLLETKDMHAALTAALGKLKPKYQVVIKLYYGLEEAPLTFAEIGKRLNLTGCRVAMIHEMALKVLKRRETITMLKAVKTI
jgi:DNA-directed RNA polymerase sigma subunit (sigma70/sigma32)